MADDPVVVIRCMDERFQDEWAALMQKELGKHYVISCVGGVRSLLPPLGEGFLSEQLGELRRIFGRDGFKRTHFVLVAHSGCKAYGEGEAAEIKDIHLARVVQYLTDYFAGNFESGVPHISVKYLQHYQNREPTLRDTVRYMLYN